MFAENNTKRPPSRRPREGEEKDEHKKRQREGKATERAAQKKLIDRLDTLVPVAAVPGRFLNGGLRSKRTTVQLYEDCVNHCRQLQDPHRADPEGAQEGKHGSRGRGEGAEAQGLDPSGRLPWVSGQELMEACLSSSRERLLVVELPEWTVVEMSARLRQDFASAAFEGDLIGQSFGHSVDFDSLNALRSFSKLMSLRQGDVSSLSLVITVRTFRSNSLVDRRMRMTTLHARPAGSSIFMLEPAGEETRGGGGREEEEEPDWNRRDMMGYSGCFGYDFGRSTSTPYDFDRAIYEVQREPRSVTMMSMILPKLQSEASSSAVIDRVASTSAINALQKTLYSFILSHHELQIMFDNKTAHEIPFAVFLRLKLPLSLGGYRSPWVKVVEASLNGSLCGSFAEQGRIYSYIVHDEHCGVYRSIMEEPFVYKYVLKRVGDVDRALQADWLLQHAEESEV
ncbi:hypothetical protein GUITHDRAFT_122865 [Guillardia theta CCMP2712]|uniref:Uncharacterized protein n=1 Tax=Guillardia theta (strain CCMP2712) TaxID=905079 RepID=L1I3V8_GUITC|nr:hypothetical protein GUITHDRAFT_122865 [Guillardia theta CCMP2712]EKX30928.1 hypothetical protein GUITHDRAFT_122865 [Guillardia theta CCMP2712]|eukprot:XP_005817908.1 hypothetical protein GUITHDRAFT_122865 [Guillardia theta CCMP2712]